MAIKRVDVEGGDWLDVKEVLKIGDKANVQGYASDGIAADQKSFNYNIVRHQIASAAVRILNWSLKDGEAPITYPVGKPFDDRTKAVADLSEDDFARVYAAVESFEESLSKEKNAPKDGAIA